MQLKAILILASKEAKSRTTPTFTGIVDVVFWATPISENKIIKERKKKKDRTGFKEYFFMIILLSTYG
jgi:hypothetical protein